MFENGFKMLLNPLKLLWLFKKIKSNYYKNSFTFKQIENMENLKNR